jgi:uncharacterized protein (UPF0332 family)
MTPPPPPFNWEDYLKLANDLSVNPDEASRRTSISRAYYAVFHAATNHAKANGYNERSHGRLWRMYHSDADKNAKRLANIGNRMKAARENADYAGEAVLVDDAIQQLSDASSFSKILAEVPITSPQPLPPNPKKTCATCGTIQT